MFPEGLRDIRNHWAQERQNTSGKAVVTASHNRRLMMESGAQLKLHL